MSFNNVLQFPNKPWYWFTLSMNSQITLNDVLQYPNKPWDWYGLSKNHNTTFDHVLQYPDKPWSWSGLSRNPNIFKLSDTDLIKSCREWNSAKRIQKAWRTAIGNPEYCLCKMRLRSEFETF